MRRVTVAINGEINRAGDLLRDLRVSTDGLVEWQRTNQAIRVVREFCAGFQYPMRKTTVGLRQFVQRASETIIVAQRLKRFPQIIFTS